MSARYVRYYRNQGMNASLTGIPISCKHGGRVSFQNHYSTATPSGDFSYEISNDPNAGQNPSAAQWTAITVSTAFGAQPAGSAAGTYAVCFTGLFGFIRQKWTRVAGGASDLLNTWVSVDDDG